MEWEYKFDATESQHEALKTFTRLDADGWEVLSCWGTREVQFLLRRRARGDQSDSDATWFRDEVIGDDTDGPDVESSDVDDCD